MGPLTSIDISDEDETDSDDSITFAPDDFDLLLHGVKDNRFGLGYKGLHESVAQFNRKSGTFEVMGKNNKKVKLKLMPFHEIFSKLNLFHTYLLALNKRTSVWRRCI